MKSHVRQQTVTGISTHVSHPIHGPNSNGDTGRLRQGPRSGSVPSRTSESRNDRPVGMVRAVCSTVGHSLIERIRRSHDMTQPGQSVNRSGSGRCSLATTTARSPSRTRVWSPSRSPRFPRPAYEPLTAYTTNWMRLCSPTAFRPTTTCAQWIYAAAADCPSMRPGRKALGLRR